MGKQRVDRLNSLLKEVISEVIRKEVKNPRISELVTVTRVEVTRDLSHAKVYISVIGDKGSKVETINGLKSASKFIGYHASKRVVLRFFPALFFHFDEGLERQFRIQELLDQVKPHEPAPEEDLGEDSVAP